MTVARFSRTERAVHWSFSALFFALLATGSVLWVPSLSAMVGQRELVRRLHLWAGLALIPVPVAIALAGNRGAVWRSVRDLERFDRDDRAFVAGRPSEPDRFNGGQRLNTWWTVASAVLFLASGVVQWQWTRFPAEWRRGASELHDVLVVLGVVVVLGHLYLATVHRTTRPALRGIVTGRVDAAWARAKHPRWDTDAASDMQPHPHPQQRVGRRAVLGGIGAGVIALVTGGRLLPRITLPFSDGGWRIYNVAGHVPPATGFTLQVDGMVQQPLSLSLADVLGLPQHEVVEDFECVTGWRVRNVRWEGVRIDQLLDRAGAHPHATHLTFHSRDGVYTDSLSITDATSRRTMLATAMNGDRVSREHGGPVRLVVPSMYGYKSVKWVGRIEVTDHQDTGYWEQRGYARDARIDRSVERVYRGETYAVPGLPYAVALPPHWRTRALPGGGAVLRAPVPERVEVSIVAQHRSSKVTRDESRALLTGLERAGLANARYGAIGDADTLTATDGSGQRFLFAFSADDRRVLQVQCQAPDATWDRWLPTFEQLVSSVARPGRGSRA